MTDDWDFYPCFVNGEPASVFVNLSLREVSPLPDFPHVAYVSLLMLRPRPDGLSSQEEFDALTKLEDELIARLELASSTKYVGRNTSNGCRDFYFYTAARTDWQDQVRDAMRSHTEYRYMADVRPDPGWSTYLEFLYPGARSMETIQNRRTCDVLERRGDNLAAIREIDHWAYFNEVTSRDKFIGLASALGFRLRVEGDARGDDGQFVVQLYRADAPAHIDDAALALFDAAEESGGAYDGWETQVVA